MHEKGPTKKQLADAVSKHPSMITRWLSGEHDITISTLEMLSSFFGQPIVTVVYGYMFSIDKHKMFIS